MKQWMFGVLLSLAFLTLAGACAVDLGKTTVPLDGRNVKSEETNLGNFIADAMRNATGADVAVVHAFAFRPDALVDKGIVTDQAMRNALGIPTSTIVKLKLTPAMLREVMLYALSSYPKPGQWFLQFSGMEVTFDSSKPKALRVVGITVADKPLDFANNTTKLTVAMPRELAAGGAGYHQLFLADEVAKTMELTEITLIDATCKEFAKQKEISPKVEPRLKDIAPQPKAGEKK